MSLKVIYVDSRFSAYPKVCVWKRERDRERDKKWESIVNVYSIFFANENKLLF